MGKKSRVVSGKDYGRWAEMIHEILANIFLRIPVDEMVRIVPLVCKGWMEMVTGPSCWREIDLSEWCLRRTDTRKVDIVVIKLIRWSNSTFQRLSTYRLGNSSFIFMANRANCLTVLQIPMSNITDHVVLNHIKSLPDLIELDISGCSHLTIKGIEAFGNQCKSLVCLKRNMSPMRLVGTRKLFIAYIHDSEAKTVANTMPNLQHLELCYGRFGDVGLSEILTKCKSLSRLDIRGSRHVNLEGSLKDRFQRIKYIGLWSPFITKTTTDTMSNYKCHQSSDSEGSYDSEDSD